LISIIFDDDVALFNLLFVVAGISLSLAGISGAEGEY
jgi:hypothetical protein